MEAYQMKPSGVEWLGDVPEHWKVKRIKDLVCLRSGDTITSLQINKEGKYPVYGGNGLRGYSSIFTHEGRRVLIGRQGALCGNINYAKGKFFASEHAVVCNPYLNLNTFWFGELLRSMDLNQHSNAAAQPGLAVEKIKNLKIPVPAKKEQQAIADYLDQACNTIDQTIEVKKKQLKKLAVYRKSVIHEAVTKGLDKNVPMKPSGVEWLGDVPEHWKVSKLKNFGLGTMTNGIFKKKEHYGKGTKLINVTDLYQDNNIVDYEGLDRVDCDTNEVKRYAVNDGDIFFVRSSLKLEGIGVSALAEQIKENTVFECHIIRFRPNQAVVHPKFILYQLNSECVQGCFVASSKTVTMTTISQDKIASIKLAKAPIDEQQAIANYLDQTCNTIDQSKQVIEKQVAKLTEYRKSLIHECVTGKKRIYQGEV